MVKKMPKKKMAVIIMICSCVAMLAINIFAWNFSAIGLMLVAAAVSLIVFMVSGGMKQKGGEAK